MRLNLLRVISDNAKTAQITTEYKRQAVTRHCIKTSAGFKGHHPDTPGVRSMKRAVAEVKHLEGRIEICEKDLRASNLSDERREELENRLLNLQNQLAPAKEAAKVLEDKFPEFVLYGG